MGRISTRCSLGPSGQPIGRRAIWSVGGAQSLLLSSTFILTGSLKTKQVSSGSSKTATEKAVILRGAQSERGRFFNSVWFLDMPGRFSPAC